jgi:Tfp pilus assembly protein PilX
LVRARIKRQQGALLIGIVVMLVVVALSVAAMYSMHYLQRALAQSRASVTGLERIDAALAAFVAQHRRLPCPAIGSLASGLAGAGAESINLTNGACVPATQIDGVVPWSTLGLSESDANDPWNGRISYRVQPSLASNTLLLMNMSWCDPAGTANSSFGLTLACTAPCVGNACTNPRNYLYGKGLQVKDAGAAWLNQPSPPWTGSPASLPASTGAAYVLISHGPNGIGAYNNRGLLQNQNNANTGTNELSNSNGKALITATTVFIDAPRNDNFGTAWFDDQLSHPTLATVLAAAALGPRTPH